jgi:hypothetical protein
MVTIVKFITGLLLGGLLFASCNSGPSLQEYLVDKQEDNNFVKVDLATSLLYAEEDKLSPEQKEVLKTVKKINVVAYPMKDNEVEYTAERTKILDILSQERYQTLMKMGSNKKGVTLKYLGEDDAIDEVIIYGNDSERGFIVFRLLGKDMNPGDMIRMVETMDTDNVNLSALAGIEALF